MARVKGAMMTRKHRKKILGLAKGYWGNKSRHYKMANQQMMKSGRYAYVGRKQKKRDFRKLWIQRINAAVRAEGITYNRFIQGLRLAGIELDRRALAEIAVSDPDTFKTIVDAAKAALPEDVNAPVEA